MEGMGRRFLARQVADPELRAKLTPTYTPGCKRLLQSNDYYPALQRPNVTVETEKILEVTAGRRGHRRRRASTRSTPSSTAPASGSPTTP